MKHLYRSFSIIAGLLCCVGMLRSETEDRSQYKKYFTAAAAEFNVPVDVLRGVAFSTTRWSQLQWEEGDTVSACSKMPRVYGVMGLWDNDIFGRTLRQAAALIRKDVKVLKTNPLQNIRGGAALLKKLYDETPKPDYAAPGSVESWENAIARYTGIPQPELSHKHVLGIYTSLQAGYHQYGIDIDARSMDLEPIRKNVAALQSSANAVQEPVNSLHKATATPDYPLAIWVPGTPGMYYSASDGFGKIFVVIHDMEGYYAAVVAYFKIRTDASIHYCINSVQNNAGDSPAGEVTQMVQEQYYAWHAVCLNRYSLGIEHEGFVGDPSWYTEAMYQSSANLVKYMCNKYDIPKDRNHIIGHNEWQNKSWNAFIAANFPAITPTCNNHTDPGQYWNWSYYMGLVKKDTTRPVVRSASVLKTVQAYDRVIVTFSQIMDTASVNQNFSITPAIQGTFSWDATNRSLTFLPSPYLAFETSYTIAIDTGAHNDLGIGMDANGDGVNDLFSTTITTGKLIPPTITLTQPKMNDTAFSVAKQIILRFSDPMDTASVRKAFIVTPEAPGKITWTVDNKTVYLTPAAPLAYSTKYTVRMEASARSIYGAGLDANQDSVSGDPYVNVFTTIAAPTGVRAEAGMPPKEFALAQNYPNPFNPSTHFQFSLPSSELARLSVYDVVGREVAVLVNETLNAGTYTFEWNAKDMTSGVYFYTLKAGQFSRTQKLLLNK
jgi:N-acetyl-anhydromuramyl-L-alanine amidase AmpD